MIIRPISYRNGGIFSRNSARFSTFNSNNISGKHQSVMKAFANRLYNREKQNSMIIGGGNTSSKTTSQKEFQLLKNQLDRKRQLSKTEPPDQRKVIPENSSDTVLNIQDLPVRQVQSQEQMTDILNNIFKSDQKDTKIKFKPKPHPAETSGQDQTPVQMPQQIKQKFQEKRRKVIQLISELKKQILDDDHINYLNYIDIVGSGYQQFNGNQMMKAIIQRNICRYNLTQLFKIPEDSIGRLIDIIIKKIYLENKNK